MRLGSGPKCDWVPGPNEIRTWDKMRISEMVEVRGEGNSVGYRCRGIAAILSIDVSDAYQSMASEDCGHGPPNDHGLEKRIKIKQFFL